MTQEEKAKAYDEALLRAKSKIKNDKDHVLYEDDVIEIFPELKESEDEKIRKDLIQWIDEFPDTIWRGHYKKEILAWFKKQGEQKPAWSEEDEKMVKDIIAAIDALYYHGMVKWLKSLKERIG
jgi:beta-glucosidase/6-phospho-beta-glucosidase/beta-galactosidase